MSTNSNQYDYERRQNKATRDTVNTGAVCKVIGFDGKKMTVDVQPIAKRLVDGQYQDQPPILSVPVAGMSGGGFQMSQNYSSGDVVTISYTNQDIDNSMSQGQNNTPNTDRKRSGSDAICTGGVHAGGSTNTLPAGSYGFGTAAADLYVIIHEGKIKLKGDVEIEGTVKILGNLNITGDISVTGSIAVDGSITATGTITP